MQSNKKPAVNRVYTHEGGAAERARPEDALRRSVMTCLLWEDTFYEDGVSIAERIKELIPQCDPLVVANMALEARHAFNMRHVSLLMVRELARNRYPKYPKLVEATIPKVIARADELAEFLSMYWADGKCPLSHEVRRGLARAFRQFNEYQFAKYNRDRAIKLRDVMFLTHPKPESEEQAALFKRIADNMLAAPDTWEVALSGGADKKEAFTRLLTENKLGMLALLRNMRNMHSAGVSPSLMASRMYTAFGRERVLPFRYIAAARACPAMEREIDAAMLATFKDVPEVSKLPGTTAVLVDVSSSMHDMLSDKSDLSRLDAASALAVLCRLMCQHSRVFTFSTKLVEVPPRDGMALIDAISTSQMHSSTYLSRALCELHNRVPDAVRTIVITDEQSQDGVHLPIGKGYLLNVASYQNGVKHGEWTRITGFSEAVLSYIMAMEQGA